MSVAEQIAAAHRLRSVGECSCGAQYEGGEWWTRHIATAAETAVGEQIARQRAIT